MIIGLCGTNGAGKNTVTDYLVQKGFIQLSVRADVLIPEIKARGMEITRDAMIVVGNDLRAQYGADYPAKKLCEIGLASGKHVAIESFRTRGEVAALKSHTDAYLRGIDADPQIRYQRIKARNDSNSDNVTFEEFIAQEQKELENTDPNKQNIRGCLELADHTFLNNGKVEELYAAVDSVLGSLPTFLINQ